MRNKAAKKMNIQDNRALQVYADGPEYVCYLLPERGDQIYFGTFRHEGLLTFGIKSTTTVGEFMAYFFSN